jgi:acetyl esterase/lipase
MFTKSVLFASILGIAMASAQAAPPPAEAYGRLPALGDVAISPDGKRVAISVGGEYHAAEPDRDLTALRIINIDTGKVEHTLAPPPSNTLRGVSWADDKTAYYVISAAADAAAASSMPTLTTMRGQRVEFFRTGVFSLETGNTTILMEAKEYKANGSLTNLTVPIEGDPGFGRMVAYGGIASINAQARLTVFRVNMSNGAGTPLESGNSNTRGFMLDEKGQVFARVDINDRSDKWRLFVYDKGKDRLLLEDVSEMGQPLAMFGRLQDGRIAAVDPHEEGARDTLLAIDPVTGAKTELTKSEGSDVGAVGDPWLHRVVGMQWIDDLPKQTFFDKQLQDISTAVQPLFESGFAVLASWSKDRSRVVVYGERAGDAGAYYVYEPAANKMRSLGKLYPALASVESLGDRRSIKYPARDGTAIPAYLTLPAGVEPKKLPLVLLVHGGPHARDTFTFNWWSSFLASRGYAVLQPNYRGSTGYGYDWFNAGRGQWGTGFMQTDVEDGAAALVKNGMVDASRVCIMGGSYGGYAALAGATLTPEKYACAVSVNGVFDLGRMIDAASRGGAGKRGGLAEWWRKSMGDDPAKVRSISPSEHADKVRAPVLIIHGVDDAVVPVDQSRSMQAKLDRAGKSVRYVELKGDDHWLSDAPTRTKMLQEIEKFLAAHLGGAAAAPASARAN